MPQNYSEAPEIARVTRIPDVLINQIAAGEVVERPASALKEILENSLDAGARRVEISLRDGGMTEITVVDDGRGIHPEDMELCLERHATSKIHEAGDLESIGTYGFRGEALASIASVSELELRSRTATAASGLEMSVHFGIVQQPPRPVGAPVGTKLTIRNLFARLPARLKFLRSASTEFSHCARVVKELAVGNPQVQFNLQHQGRTVASYSSPTREGRLQEAFKWDWAPLVVEEDSGDLHLTAFLSPGDRTQDRGELLLYINQRPVRNRGLLAAIRQGYLSTLGPHHEPSGVVFLEIRRDWVDVNVHPQKTEVRCLKQESLYSWLLSAVRKAVAVQPSVRPLGESATDRGFADRPTPAANAPSVPPSASFASGAGASTFSDTRFAPSTVSRPVQRAFDDAEATLFADRVESAPEMPSPGLSPSPPKVRQWRYLGQVRAAYLICEDALGLVVVDQHALHEKFRFEELWREQKERGLQSQRLLIPKVLRIQPELAPVLEENASELQRLGFEVEPFGDGDWAIKAVPELIEEAQAEKLVLETLRALIRFEESPDEVASRAVRPILATVACHSVVRAGQNLSPTEAGALLDRLDTIELGWTCPHGRPVAFRLGFGEMEKHFERK